MLSQFPLIAQRTQSQCGNYYIIVSSLVYNINNISRMFQKVETHDYLP